jgi:hypothetical protein|tara:strand:+ start:265 stop:459 length:195 start_codon:yes stop_codon:yes gene_type:complete
MVYKCLRLSKSEKLHIEIDNCRHAMVQCDLSTDDGLKQYRLLQKIEAAILKDISDEQVRSISNG